MDISFKVRRATVVDVPVIARHRAAMFTDMGLLRPELCDALVTATRSYLELVIPAGDYIGWLASPTHMPEKIVAGAGILLRKVPPHPCVGPAGVFLASGRQGIVLNVFTERAWRRRGLAALLMGEALAWSAGAGLETLVLHASEAGRSLYERLGFVGTNEMSYRGPLLPSSATLTASL